MANNIFQKQVEAEVPKVLSEERIYVYVPKATNDQAGIATYNQTYFNVDSNGNVSIKPHVFALLNKFNENDFDINGSTDEIDIKWPHAYNGDEGIVKVNTNGYLKFEDNELTTNDTKLEQDFTTKTEYNSIIELIPDGTTSSNKLINNNELNTQLALKVNVSDYNARFGNWDSKPTGVTTVRSWFDRLETEDDYLQDLIKTIHKVLGVFETPQALQTAYPASEELLGVMAFVLSSETYWAVRTSGSSYEWYDTQQTADVSAFMETSASAYRPDGIPSAGSSNKWAQSNHVHPTDTTRLDANTEIEVISVYDATHENDFDVKLHEEGQGTTRTLNIPYVRKAQSIHNYQGQSVFSDTEASCEYYWAGTTSQFESEKDNIKNNSLIIVDDDEASGDQEVDLINRKMMSVQGITIDLDTPTERFVTIDSDIYSTLTNNYTPITIKRFTDTLTGDYRYKIARLWPVTDTIRFGLPLISNGMGGIIGLSLGSNKILTSKENGELASTPVDSRQLVVNDTTTQLSPGKLVITSTTQPTSSQTSTPPTYSTITTFSTGSIENAIIGANGSGGIKTMTFTANRLLCTDSYGGAQVLAMSTTDAGKAVGVSALGTPTLLTIPTVPTSMPVSVYTSDPGNNLNGYVVCKLTSDPGTYSDGVLYMW